MQITKINAELRYSKEVEKGVWRSMELGAEGTLAPGEDRKEAHQLLYSELAAQLTQLWNIGDAKCAKPEALPAESATSGNGATDPHWCQEHGEAYLRRSQGTRFWYSHKLPTGGFCKEVAA